MAGLTGRHAEIVARRRELERAIAEAGARLDRIDSELAAVTADRAPAGGGARDAEIGSLHVALAEAQTALAARDAEIAAVRGLPGRCPRGRRRRAGCAGRRRTRP